MALDLYPLIQLHYLDQQIAILNNSVFAMPAQIQELDKKLERHIRTVQDRQSSITENTKKRRQLEGDLALIETKRTRYKEQLDTVKTNKEYTALQHEIETVSQAIRQIEDQILSEMEAAEYIKTHLQEAQKAKEREEKIILEEKNALQAQVDKLQGELDEFKAQRDKWVAQVPTDVMEVYTRTAMHRRGIAMAEAKNEICQECHMRIRPQLFQEIKRNDSIITCESCSRILYYAGAAGKQEVEPSNPEGAPGDAVRT